jgi:flavin reductase (DIM6/NTAB) family NADH-FMN oxidoreductase RutF
MHLDPEEEPESVYRTLSSLVVPRPIGWISTLASDGTDNLAPFSYFNAVTNHPPTVMFSASDREGERKDTPRNALETGEFVANLVTRDLLSRMDVTATHTGESEFDLASLERVPAETVTPPRVGEARAHLECEVIDSLRIGTNTLVFGQVRLFHVDDSLLTDGKVDSAKVDAVGRCGGPYYTGIDLLSFHRGDG